MSNLPVEKSISQAIGLNIKGFNMVIDGTDIQGGLHAVGLGDDHISVTNTKIH